MTDQNYKELVELYGKYKSKGFEILAFPCNQFGAQESGSNEQIKAFAKNYGATFPIMDKVEVNGDGAADLLCLKMGPRWTRRLSLLKELDLVMRAVYPIAWLLILVTLLAQLEGYEAAVPQHCPVSVRVHEKDIFSSD